MPTLTERDVRLSPRLLIAAMSAFAEVLAGGGADGWDAERRIARNLRRVPGERWDVALVQHCGYWSHFDHECEASAWPIAEARTADDLGAFGAARGLLFESPVVGDVLLQHNPRRKAFVRAGVVARIIRSGHWSATRPYFDVISLEGDTGDAGDFGGNGLRRVERRLAAASGDRFLRWWLAEGS